MQAAACSAPARPVRARAARRVVSAAASAPAAGKASEKTTKPLNIVFVSAEVAPWSKTGGLGDVVGSLPVELAKRGHKVYSVSPRYDQYEGAWDTEVVADVLGEQVRFFHEHKRGVDRVFVDHPLFLAKVQGKTGSKLYGPASGADFSDNAKRFALFCHAALASISSGLPFAPGDGAETVIVANDWHSALVPVLLKTVAQPAGKLLNTRCALTIHNIAFQGRFWPEALATMGVPPQADASFQFEDGVPIVFSEETPAGPDGELPVVADPKARFPKINWLKAGILHADKNLTVSPNYAREVMSGADKGVELHDIIAAAGGLTGIVNGMDTADWDPSTDKYLDLPFNAASVVVGKAAAKETLQAEVGLPLEPSAPLFGYIGRLEEQKGVDILLAAIPGVLKAVPNAQFVVLGTGKKALEVAAKKLAASSAGRAVGVCQFSEPLAHLITAGADFLAVPSRFEPCGLIQLHAMRYGTVPIVASTGGLVDTVAEGVTGWQIGTLDADDLVTSDVTATVAACSRAAAAFATPKHAAMSAACISQDLSWAEPARKWEAVLEGLLAAGASDAGADSAARMAAAFAASKAAAVPTPAEVIQAVLTPSGNPIAVPVASFGPAKGAKPAAAAAPAPASAAPKAAAPPLRPAPAAAPAPPAAVAFKAASDLPAPPPVKKAAAAPKVPGAPPVVKDLVTGAAAAAAGVKPKPAPGSAPAPAAPVKAEAAAAAAPAAAAEPAAKPAATGAVGKKASAAAAAAAAAKASA